MLKSNSATKADFFLESEINFLRQQGADLLLFWNRVFLRTTFDPQLHKKAHEEGVGHIKGALSHWAVEGLCAVISSAQAPHLHSGDISDTATLLMHFLESHEQAALLALPDNSLTILTRNSKVDIVDFGNELFCRGNGLSGLVLEVDRNDLAKGDLDDSISQKVSDSLVAHGYSLLLEAFTEAKVCEYSAIRTVSDFQAWAENVRDPTDKSGGLLKAHT